MITEVNKHKGFAILFDSEKESFIVESDKFDVQKGKVSYAASVKFIDEYIKANVTFEPFFIDGMRYGREGEKVKIVGIRNDGSFVYDHDGKKVKVSDYDIKGCFLWNDANESIYKKIDEYQDKIDRLQKEQRALATQIIKDDLGLIETSEKYKSLFL